MEDICIKMKDRFETINVSHSQVTELKNANMLGQTFVKLGAKYYNVNSIEYWYEQKRNKELK